MGLMDKLEDRFMERFAQMCQSGQITIEIIPLSNDKHRVHMYIKGECFDITKE